MRKLVAACLFLAACSSDLPHEAPFDPNAPLDKQAKASLSGTIRLEGETDFSQVTLDLQNAERTYNVDTAADGAVSLTGIVPGAYTLKIRTRYFQAVTEPLTVEMGSTVDLGRRTLAPLRSRVLGQATAEKIEGTELVTKGGVALSLRKTASVRAAVNQSPAFGKAATPIERDRMFSTLSGAGGEFEFPDVPAGGYELSAATDEEEERVVGTVTVTGEGDVTVDPIVLRPLTGYFEILGSAGGAPSSTYTSVAAVNLQLQQSNAVKVKVAVSTDGTTAGCDLTNVTPETLPSNTLRPLTFTSEGKKLVCVSYVDADGKETAPIYGSITYDATPPTLPSVAINGGVQVVSNNLVTLSLSAVDTLSGVGVLKVHAVNDFGAIAPKPFQPTDVYSLSTGDGLKTVWVVFGDHAGNYSPPVSATVLLDTTPPSVSGGVTLAKLDGTPLTSGDTIAESRVKLTSTVNEATPVLEMQVTTTGSYAGQSWVAYDPAKTIELPGGASTISVRVRDGAGHVVDLVTAFVLTTDTTPPTGTLVIAASAVTAPAITVQAAGSSDAVGVELAFDPGFVTSLGTFTPGPIAVTLSAGDGIKTVYGRFFDAAGNTSALVGDTVTLDTTPPQILTYSLAQASPTKDNPVTVNYSASGAAELRITEGSACGGAREPVGAGTRSFTLSSSEGVKSIALQFFDTAGNASECAVRTIYLDQNPPVIGTLQINYGDAATSSSVVTLAFPGVSGATRLMASEDAAFSGADWQSFAATKTFILSPGNGVKTVYAKVADDAGNVVSLPSDSITVDTAPPTTPSIFAAIDVTTQTSVLLTLSAGLVSEMWLTQDDPAFSTGAWEPYSGSKVFALTGTDGTKTIYAKFKKSTGLETSVVTDTVVLDRTAPTLPSVRINNGASVVTSNIVTLNLSAVDVASGLSTYKVNTVDDFTVVSPKPYQPTDVFSFAAGDGLKTVWVVFLDKAGNYGAAASATALLDGSNPLVGSASLELLDGTPVNNGDTVRESRLRLVTSVSDLTTLEMQVSTNGSFTGAAWEPYASSKLIDLPSSGTPTIAARVRDQAGHVVTLLAGINVSVDTAAPVGAVSRTSPAVTNSTTVELLVSANESSDAQVSEDPAFSGAVWFPTASTTYILSAGDGLRTIYVRWRDAAGNVSVAKTAQVTLDQTPPQLATFSIAQGTQTNQPTVSLVLSAAGADQMRVTEAAVCGGAWEAYATSKGFTFGSGVDGTKTISMQFKDNAGNLTGCLSRTIALDTQAPTFTAAKGIIINDDDVYTTSRTVAIAVNVTEATEIMLSESATFAGATWQSAVTATNWALSAGEGAKTLYLKVRDAAGNEAAVQSDSVTLDTIAPAFNTASAPSVSAVENITIGLAASGAAQMRLSETADFGGASYVSFNASAPFALASVEGVHTVYIQLVDAAGNESLVRSVSVTLDKSAPNAPVVSVIEGAYTPTAAITLQVLAAGASEMLVSQYAPMTDATWQPFSQLKSFTLAGAQGAKTIYVKVRDAALNESAPSSVVVTFDGTGPNVTLFQAEDAGGSLIIQSNQTRFYLHLAATDATPMTVQFNSVSTWSGIPAEALQTIRAWDAAPPVLSAGENRSVYARVVDAAGNAAVVGPVTVFVDTQGPTAPSLTMAPALVSSPTVTLSLGAVNADNVELSEDISFLAPTVLAYAASAPYTFLNTSDGVKTLYARYVDALGNYSGIVVASVTLDQTEPKFASFSIAQASPTKSGTVNLALSAIGADFMAISENACAANWEAYQTAKAYAFATTVNGTKTIAVRFKDAVGNATSCLTQTIDFDNQPPTLMAPAFRINYGDAATSNATVTLVSNVVGAADVRVSEDSSLADAAWVPYSAARTFVLSAGNGTKTVYAQYRDLAGNATAIINDTIVLDTTQVGAPYISIQADVTSSTMVTVNLGASNIDEMILSDRNDFATGTGWVAYTGVTTFTFGGADGTKTLFAKFRKSSGAETVVVSDNYILDRVVPSFSQIVINNGAQYATTNQLTLALTGVDDTSGVQLMEYYEDGAGATQDQYKPALVFPVSAAQGAKIVWVRFADRANNFAAPVSATIVLDSLPPSVSSFQVEDAAGIPLMVANSARVAVHLVAADANPLQMLVSNRSDFAGSAWQPYQEYLQWDLPLPTLAGGEARTVYAKVRDAAGATVSAGSYALTLDTIAPSNVALDIVGTAVTSPTVTVNFTYSNADLIELSQDPGFQTKVTFAALAATTYSFAAGDGAKTLYARFADNAGNYSATAVDQITLDTTPPQLAAFNIAEGELTNQTMITLALSAIDAAQMQVREGATCGGVWEPFAASKALPISAANETKTIAVRFRDAAGNTTTCLTRSITLDTAAPTFTAGKGIVINNDDLDTTSRTVNLALNVTDASQIMISEHATFVGAAWQPAVTSAVWALSAGEGTKTLYLKARDAAGNETVAQSDSIIVDTIAPVFSTVTGPTVSSTESITLAIAASGATKMRLSENADLTGEPYGAFNAAPGFTLASAEGVHAVYVQLADDAGNETLIRSVNVTLDKSAPSAPVVSVLEGAYTKSAAITLQVLAAGASQMLVSQYAPMTDATWQPYSQVLAYTLAGGDGAKTLFVRVRDEAGNTSVASSAAVVLDGAAPSITAFDAKDAGGNVITQTNATRFYLQVAVTDATPVYVQFSAANVWAGVPLEGLQALRAWDVVPPTLSAGEDRLVYVRVVDAAGNASVAGPLTVLVDTIGPAAPSLALSPGLVSSPTVAVSFSASDATAIELSENVSFLTPTVLAYSASSNYTFVNTADGSKTLYARYADGLGNYSAIVAASTVLDATPPSAASVVIDAGNAYSTSLGGAVSLSLAAADTVSGLASMKVANLGAGSCAAALVPVPSEPFSPSKAWTLSPNGAGIDEQRWVCASFSDAAGNWSAPVSDAIGYDTAAPSAVGQAIQINGGDFYATSTQVDLVLSASGAAEMMVANGATFGNSIWEPYRSQIAWLLPASAVAVERTVSVKFRDAAGNETAAYADTITLDTEAPASPAVNIDAEAPYAITSTVDLDLLAVGANLVNVSNDPYFLVSSVVPYATLYPDWELAAGDGVRAVFVQFEDFAGNRSAIVADNIIVDTQAPTEADFTITDGAFTPNLSIFLELTAVGATEMQIGEDACGGIWQPFSNNASYTFASAIDGLKTIAVRFRDYAGNLTPCIFRTITLDSTYPRITTVTPRSGYSTNFFTLYGINFNGGGGSTGSVVFGGVEIPFNGALGHSWSNSQVTSRVPLMTVPGPYDIFVRTGNGKDSNSTVFVAYPLLQSASPTVARVLESVVLSGVTFGYTVGSVTIGGVAASVLGWSPTAVTVAVPASLNAGYHEVKLTAAGLLSTGTTWVAVRPVLTSVTPGTGSQGTLITLTGAQFGTDSAAGRVEVGRIAAPIVTWSPTQIQATVPPGVAAGQTSVQVFVNGLMTEALRFEHPLPWLHASSPATATVGTPLTVLGTGLGAAAGWFGVAGNTAAISNWTATAIESEIPLGAPKGYLAITASTADGVTTNTLRVYRRGADQWYRTPRQAYHSGATMVWTGIEVIVWGGALDSRPYRYNPATDTWLLGTDVGAPATRAGASAVWTGKEVIVYGGQTQGSTGGRYNPATDSWAPMAGGSSFSKHVAVWNGTEMLVVSSSNQKAYSPATDSWRTLNVSGANDARAAWTGSELLVWGGSPGTSTGKLYDPYLDKARSINTNGAPAGRYAYGAVWTGTEFVVWGGQNNGTPLTDGARYNPITQAWTPMAAAPAGLEALEVNALWLGDKMFVSGNGYAIYDPVADTWSGVNPVGAASGFPVYIGDDVVVLNTANFTGGRYDVSTNTWAAITWPYQPNQFDSRTLHSAVWTGSQMLIWGGSNGSYLQSGGRYSPALDQWTPMTLTNAPAARQNQGTVWTGSEMFVWGGYNGAALGDGGRYDPSTDTWSTINSTGAPTARSAPGVVWTGSKMLVWGGGYNTGGIYYPLTDTWSTITTTGAPVARNGHATVWAGDRMLVYGGSYYTPSPGCNCYSYPSGAQYFPDTDSWSALAMSGRVAPVAVWTGSRLFIYGGYTYGFSPYYPRTTQSGGYLYDPVTNTNVAVNGSGQPIGTYDTAAAWTGTHILLFGGRSSASSGSYPYYIETIRDTAVMYDPVNDLWTNMTAAGRPSARYGHSAIWTGMDAILYGGGSSDNVIWYQPYD